jgi:hypothetical protein
MGPFQGVTIKAWMNKVDIALEKAISLDPIAASKLPAWPQGAVVPTLPAGLEWRESAERDLYEAIRAGNYQVYCIYAGQITCAADVPLRPGRMVPMLTVSNLRELYEPADAKEALAVLTGDRPQLTSTELAAAKARVEAQYNAAVEAATAVIARLPK